VSDAMLLKEELLAGVEDLLIVRLAAAEHDLHGAEMAPPASAPPRYKLAGARQSVVVWATRRRRRHLPPLETSWLGKPPEERAPFAVLDVVLDAVPLLMISRVISVPTL